ncbi:hypothetical protein, partial [Fischerella muscicola]|uniref:hypothetical protein n=1 Tax=Fischerella muscicola TaxID=92938 RepID=UPI001CA4A775
MIRCHLCDFYQHTASEWGVKPLKKPQNKNQVVVTNVQAFVTTASKWVGVENYRYDKAGGRGHKG